MNDLIQRILEAADRFEARTGLRPTSVYLGYDEHARARHLPDDSVDILRLDDEGRMRLCGLLVYRVDDSEHLAVA